MSQVAQQVQEGAWARRSERTILTALVRLAALHEPLRDIMTAEGAPAPADGSGGDGVRTSDGRTVGSWRRSLDDATRRMPLAGLAAAIAS